MVDERVYSGRILLRTTCKVEPSEKVSTSSVLVVRARSIRKTVGKKVPIPSARWLQVVNTRFPGRKTTKEGLPSMGRSLATDSARVWNTR